jgi:hypothetical protein
MLLALAVQECYSMQEVKILIQTLLLVHFTYQINL